MIKNRKLWNKEKNEPQNMIQAEICRLFFYSFPDLHVFKSYNTFWINKMWKGGFAFNLIIAQASIFFHDMSFQHWQWDIVQGWGAEVPSEIWHPVLHHNASLLLWPGGTLVLKCHMDLEGDLVGVRVDYILVVMLEHVTGVTLICTICTYRFNTIRIVSSSTISGLQKIICSLHWFL